MARTGQGRARRARRRLAGWKYDVSGGWTLGDGHWGMDIGMGRQVVRRLPSRPRPQRPQRGATLSRVYRTALIWITEQYPEAQVSMRNLAAPTEEGAPSVQDCRHAQDNNRQPHHARGAPCQQVSEG